MLLGLLSGAVWFGMFVGAHALVFHALTIGNRSRAIMRLFALDVLGHLGTVTLASAVGPELPLVGEMRGLLSGFAGLVLMACCFVLYLPVYYTFAASQSIQALILLERIPGGQRPLEDVFADATSDGILRQRLDSMVASGSLVRDGERYCATAKGQRIAACFRAVQRLWRLDPVG
jgi:hypothetical protein